MSTPDFYSRLEDSSSDDSGSNATDFYSRGFSEDAFFKPRALQGKKTRGLIQGLKGAVGAIPLVQAADVALGVNKPKVLSEEGEERYKDQSFLNPYTPEDQYTKELDVTSGGLISKLTGVGEPEGFGENLTHVGGAFLNPAGIVKNAPGYIKKLASQQARQASKIDKNWQRLGSLAKKDPEKQTLLKFARDHDLSPEAATLLMHSEGKAQYLSKFGKKTKKFKGAVAELKSKLGNNYEELKLLGKQGGYLDLSEAQNLSGNLGKLLSELESTHYVGSESAPVINSLTKAVESINNKPSTVKELINTRQNIAQDVNWKNVSSGDVFRNQARDIFAQAIKQKNPAIGKRLLETDKAWAKYQQFSEILDKKIPTYMIKGIPIPAPLMTSALFLGAPLIAGGIVAGAKGLVAKEVLQRLATQMAINPKYQQPLKTMQQAILRGNTAVQKRSFLLIKHIAKKEDPDFYEEIKDIEVE